MLRNIQRNRVRIERWANRKLDFLRRFLPFAKGIPSHDTLNDVIDALPAESCQSASNFDPLGDELARRCVGLTSRSGGGPVGLQLVATLGS